MHFLSGTVVWFHHHGDFSGNVTICHPGGNNLEVPFVDLVRLVGEAVRTQRIKEAENAVCSELLGLPNRFSS